MDFSSVGDLLQTGGVLAFAIVVYYQLREQTSIFRALASDVVKILERQDDTRARIDDVAGRQARIAEAIAQQAQTCEIFSRVRAGTQGGNGR